MDAILGDCPISVPPVLIDTGSETNYDTEINGNNNYV